ncbi:MAG: hypothetical protein LBK73_14210 [Treponema sp.]|nr:hypothetical protein [Treponema sp.]
MKIEHFVVSNAPKGAFELAKLTAEFNEATLAKEDILNYSYFYKRFFYKDSTEAKKIMAYRWSSHLTPMPFIIIHGIYNTPDEALFHPWRKDRAMSVGIERNGDMNIRE